VNVLVDTSVWSLVLRRRRGPVHPLAGELGELVSEGRVAMLGAVRQELLSGIPGDEPYRKLKEYLRAFPDLDLESDDYEEAAAFFNRCRARGVQGSNTDFLICAVAARRKLAIFTSDGDFQHYTRVLPIELHVPRSA
jgi:predicted nucleic acid-binding protein